MPIASSAQPGSHRVTDLGEKVVIHDVETFVGFVEGIDDEDDPMMKALGSKDAVDRVVSKTAALIARGQLPQLRKDTSGDGHKASNSPSHGSVIAIRPIELGGVHGFATDWEMSKDDFEADIKTNRFPNRSVEIMADDTLGAVALLGANAPARPLPNTRFGKATTSEVGAARCFSRHFANLELDMSDKKTEETKALETELAALKTENKALAAKVTKLEAAKTVKAVDGEVAEFTKQLAERDTKIETLETRLTQNEVDLEIDKLVAQHYTIPDRAAFTKQALESPDPIATINFAKSLMTPQPIEKRIAESHELRLAAGGSDEATDEQRTLASKRARDRATSGEKITFAKALAEEIDNIKKAG